MVSSGSGTATESLRMYKLEFQGSLDWAFVFLDLDFYLGSFNSFLNLKPDYFSLNVCNSSLFSLFNITISSGKKKKLCLIN